MVSLNVLESLIRLRTVKITLVIEITFETVVEIRASAVPDTDGHLLTGLIMSSGREVTRVKELVIFWTSTIVN